MLSEIMDYLKQNNVTFNYYDSYVFGVDDLTILRKPIIFAVHNKMYAVTVDHDCLAIWCGDKIEHIFIECPEMNFAGWLSILLKEDN